MECQNTIKKLKINKKKTIGQVVIVVEGESEEFRLLKYIFTNVLDYNYIPIKRHKIMKDTFVSKTKNNSTIIVANTGNSNIKSIMDDKNYKDNIYNLLKEDFKTSLKAIPIYIIWDRDTESNEDNVVLKSLKTFKNAMDNDYDMNGLLLLSYPCVESYEISNFDKQLYKKKFKSSKEAKNVFKNKRYSLANITENTLLNAVSNMHHSMINNDINKYDPSNFYHVNKKIYDIEKRIFKKFNKLDALSLISVMLVDLGIIYEE